MVGIRQAQIGPKDALLASPRLGRESARSESRDISAKGVRSEGTTDRFESSRPRWYAVPSGSRDKLARSLDPATVKRRIQKGRKAEHGEPVERKMRTAPAYFRTYERVEAALFALQKKYPSLVEIIDVGDSSEKVRGVADRDVLMLRLTNKKAVAQDKAKVLWFGGVHAREIANPELLLTWADEVLAAYGADPEATALLDGRVIDIIPMVNPDGHVVIEKGYSGAPGGDTWQRKNTTPPDGVDLNRNCEFDWGGAGSSSYPHSSSYRGPSAASEPEIQAIEELVSKDDYGMVIDWHSSGELNLYPWAHIRDPAPDHANLKAVAEKFTTFNGYSSIQSADLYPTGGTTEGPAYGERRIPAYTIETGDSFHQDDEEFAREQSNNWPVMTYSAKIADAPYERAQGPDLHSIRIDSESGILTAESVSTDRSEQISKGLPRAPIRAAEYVLDPRTSPGMGVALVAADGAMDEAAETVRVKVGHLLSTSPQKRLIYVRAQDANGHWGPLTAQWL